MAVPEINNLRAVNTLDSSTPAASTNYIYCEHKKEIPRRYVVRVSVSPCLRRKPNRSYLVTFRLRICGWRLIVEASGGAKRADETRPSDRMSDKTKFW